MKGRVIFPLPQGVIFDWDNTLVNTWPVIAEALNTARSAFGLETWSVAEARIKSARALSETFPEWFGENWEKARDLFYDRFAAVHCERLVAMDGAEELLRFLHEKGLPLFVVSNKKGIYLRDEIRCLGWQDMFTNIVGAGEAPCDKPARESVEMVLSGTDLRADDQRIWLVGDTQVDVEGALKAGCTPVLLHDSATAARLGVELFFSDCHTMKTALYNWGEIATSAAPQSG